jgi:hypothetical protein
LWRGRREEMRRGGDEEGEEIWNGRDEESGQKETCGSVQDDLEDCSTEDLLLKTHC